MARNRFDVDETLETPFNIKHLLRAGVYIKRHKQKMILSLVFSAISAASYSSSPPVEKSGAGMTESRSHAGFSIHAAVALQTSRRLKPQMLLAMPTAMPILAETRTFGYVVGSKAGSSMVLS